GSHGVAAGARACVSAQLDRRALRVDDAPVITSAANRDERHLELLSSQHSVRAALACLGIARRMPRSSRSRPPMRPRDLSACWRCEAEDRHVDVVVTMGVTAALLNSLLR